MEGNQHDDECHIIRLPDEIILMIMTYNEIPDWVCFSGTCKRFREIIMNDSMIWKHKFGEMLGEDCQKKIILHKNNINWLRETGGFYKLKRSVLSKLVFLSHTLFWSAVDEYLLINIKTLYKTATKKELSLYYTIFVLQDVVRKTNMLIERNCSTVLHSLTTAYYAKVMLAHLIQTYLCLKWVEKELRCILSPAFVVTVFVQWLNPDEIYSEDDVEDKIQLLVMEVEDLLNMVDKYTDLQIIETISEVIYRREQIIITDDICIETIDIIEVINNKCGSRIALAAIYHTVAARLGLECELRCVIYDRVFLEWVSTDGIENRKFAIDIDTGDINLVCVPVHPELERHDDHTRFIPIVLLEHIRHTFARATPHAQDCVKRCLVTLREFIYNLNSYNLLVKTVKETTNIISRRPESLDMYWMLGPYQKLLLHASFLKAPSWRPNRGTIKHRIHEVIINVKYAVGMVCDHIQGYYTCVIRGWEVNECLDLSKTPLNDPHYIIMTEDGSEEKIPQAFINSLSQPRRLLFIEDVLGRDFTHFDGFVYVLNKEKMIEYPDEQKVINDYRNNCLQRNN